MNIEEFREYCIQKPGVTEEFPFDEIVAWIYSSLFES